MNELHAQVKLSEPGIPPAGLLRDETTRNNPQEEQNEGLSCWT